MKQMSNEMPHLEKVKREHRALALLRFLARQPCFATNDQIVAALFDHIGLSCTQQHINECFDQLEGANLLTQGTEENLRVVKLTSKGEEVALGKVAVENVMKPGIDCPY